jgi:PIN domain nuclease of toxin-antitoxin system
VKLLLDTCTILWCIGDPEELSKSAITALENKESEIFVSPISCAEIACLVDRKKIKLDRHWKLWFRHYIGINGWEILPIDLPIVEEAYSLPPPFHADPVDRILVATSRLFQCKLISGDKKIAAYPHVESIW